MLKCGNVTCSKLAIWTYTYWLCLSVVLMWYLSCFCFLFFYSDGLSNFFFKYGEVGFIDIFFKITTRIYWLAWQVFMKSMTQSHVINLMCFYSWFLSYDFTQNIFIRRHILWFLNIKKKFIKVPIFFKLCKVSSTKKEGWYILYIDRLAQMYPLYNGFIG